jgi:hypothetical protein
MPSAAPSTRGILRRSSYQSTASTDTDNACSSLDLESVVTEMDEVSLTSPGSSDDTNSTGQGDAASSPMKPPRRNVGKAERLSRPARGPSGVPPGRSISFCEEVQERQVPIIPPSKSNDFFYDEDEIAQFRHEKFMEDAGLDPETYEPISLW